MASELGLMYTVGRHWTGSMIELGYSEHFGIENYNATFLPRKNINKDSLESEIRNNSFSEQNFYTEDTNNILRLGLTPEHILEGLLAIDHPRTAPFEACSFMSDGSRVIHLSDLCKNLDITSSTKRFLLELMKDKAQIRHSLTSLLPTHSQAFLESNQHRCNSASPRPARGRVSESDLDQRKNDNRTPNNLTTKLERQVKSSFSKHDAISYVDSLCLEGYTEKQAESKSMNSKKKNFFQTKIRCHFSSDSNIAYVINDGSNSIKTRNINTSEEIYAIHDPSVVAVAQETSKFHSEESIMIENMSQSSIQSSVIYKNPFEEVLCKLDNIPFNNDAISDNVVQTKVPIYEPPTLALESDNFQDPSSESSSDFSNYMLSNIDRNLPLFDLEVADEILDDLDKRGGQPTDPAVGEAKGVEESSKASSKVKKAVRFADEVGKELFEEQVIDDQFMPPLLRRNRLDSLDDDYRDLREVSQFSSFPSLRTKHVQPLALLPPIPSGLSDASPSGSSSSLSSLSSINEKETLPSWRLTFAQPAAQYLAFRQRLLNNNISLENVSVSSLKDDPKSVLLYGTIKVNNIAFEKHVKLRVSCDNWESYKDYPATHSAELSQSSGNIVQFDTFMFNFSINCDHTSGTSSHLPNFGISEIQFAVCFQAGISNSAGEYWDNNDGCNYVIKRIIKHDTLNSTLDIYNYQTHSQGSSQINVHPLHNAEVASPTGFLSGAAVKEEEIDKKEISPYTQDFRPNFEGFTSLTHYSSWQHYASESMYY